MYRIMRYNSVTLNGGVYMTSKDSTLSRRNVTAARKRWDVLPIHSIRMLKELTQQLQVSIASGDLLLLDGSWYVTHSGLLHIAKRNRCSGIHVRSMSEFCDPAASRWAFKATVYKSLACRGFVGYGDANPSNVSPQVRGAEMRVAETRAVNRALRKAYGIGICSVEELGTFSGPLPPAAGQEQSPRAAAPSDGNGHHPLRDRLCLLVRQHQLDPVLVKAYAADYCDVPELRQASREQIADFIKHLGVYVQSDREGLLCQLNSYAHKPVGAASAEIIVDINPAAQEKGAGAA